MVHLGDASPGKDISAARSGHESLAITELSSFAKEEMYDTFYVRMSSVKILLVVISARIKFWMVRRRNLGI